VRNSLKLTAITLAIVALPGIACAACIAVPFLVTGNSLAPLVPDGETVQGRLGTDCGDPARGDLILFTHLGFKLPLIKIVVGIPGDRFGLKADGATWNLMVNGAVAKNAEGKPYRLSKGRIGMISLYLRGTQGIIPTDAWLVMGDNPAGTDDSSRYGLVPRADFLGIARPPQPGMAHEGSSLPPASP
jgi:signal peptidase I